MYICIKLNENILLWIEDIVLSPDSDDVDHILNIMELPSYAGWEICKANKGISLEAYRWLKSNNEIYEKFHIRYLIEI